jgi:hypothetical protein
MLIIIAFIVTIGAFFLPRFFIEKHRYYVSEIIAWVLLTLHLFVLSAFIMCSILALIDLSFYGYNSTKMIFVTMIGTGIPFYLFRNKTFLPKFLNTFLSILCAFTVPAFLIYLYFILTIHKENVYYEDSKYRLEERYSFTSKKIPILYVKNGILEKKYSVNKLAVDRDKIKHIKIVQDDPSSILISIDHTDYDDRMSADPIHIYVPLHK